MAMDIAVDDYSKGQNITTWIRVRSNKDNHIRLSEYLTKGRLILVDGTLSSSCGKTRTARARYSSPSRQRVLPLSIPEGGKARQPERTMQ